MARPWFEGRKQRGTEIQDAEGTNEAGLLTRLVGLVLALLLESPILYTLCIKQVYFHFSFKKSTGRRLNEDVNPF